jgi:hypothetical protein
LKLYRPTGQLLADVKSVLATGKPSRHHSPLEDVVALLCCGRHYAWMGIFLAVGENAVHPSIAVGTDQVGQVELPETRSTILISMKLGIREVGVLGVENDDQNGFPIEDQVLLERVANDLARFLTGRGKYLVRSARLRAARA